ncbi:unnamed protein product, partial [Urochloa humidicola]
RRDSSRGWLHPAPPRHCSSTLRHRPLLHRLGCASSAVDAAALPDSTIGPARPPPAAAHYHHHNSNASTHHGDAPSKRVRTVLPGLLLEKHKAHSSSSPPPLRHPVQAPPLLRLPSKRRHRRSASLYRSCRRSASQSRCRRSPSRSTAAPLGKQPKKIHSMEISPSSATEDPIVGLRVKTAYINHLDWE